MGQYIDVDYLISVISDQALRTIVSARLTPGTAFAYEDDDVAIAIDTAIATAESIAEAKLGRRFSPAELDALQEGDATAVKQAIARIAAYELAPSMMARSEELRADNDRACGFLRDIGKREYSAGRSDPDPPPKLSSLVPTTTLRGLSSLSNV